MRDPQPPATFLLGPCPRSSGRALNAVPPPKQADLAAERQQLEEQHSELARAVTQQAQELQGLAQRSDALAAEVAAAGEGLRARAGKLRSAERLLGGELKVCTLPPLCALAEHAWQSA